MIIQRCPRCGSSRIRRGYRRTPWWNAIFGRYNLLCNSCNWEFVGLAIPGTVSDQHSRKKKKRTVEQEQIQSLTAQEAKQFAETRKLRETNGLEINNRSLEEAADDLQSSPIGSPVSSESHLENIGELNVLPKIRATADNSSNSNEAADLVENVPGSAANNAPPEVAVKTTAANQRPKIRKRVKSKK